MNINKELIFKESLPFFKNLSKEEKNILYDASHIEEYKAGELFIQNINLVQALF